VKIFGRKSLAAEIDGLNTRKGLLAKQLATVEEKLDEALASRQARLLEADDLDAPPEQTLLIERLRDERSAVVDALAAIDVKLIAAQQRLAEEQESRQREAAAKELAAKADALAAVAADLAGTVARVPAVLSDVLARLPAPHVVSPERVAAFANGLVEALQLEVGEAQRYIAQLTAGDVEVIPPREEEVKLPPAPKVERREVLLLVNGRWPELDGTISTSGAYTTCSPPASIAARAIEFGHGVDSLSDHAITLRQRVAPRYGHYPPQDCVDLNAPKPEKLPAGSRPITTPLVHSEFARGRAGTAVVSRNSR
jgi:hypothetical protein